MDDATKAAVGRVRSVLAQESFDEGDFEGTDLAAILAHIAVESARLAAERARVVAWLRSQAATGELSVTTERTLRTFATAIERGEHEEGT